MFSSALEKTFSRMPLKATMLVSLPMDRLVSICRLGKNWTHIGLCLDKFVYFSSLLGQRRLKTLWKGNQWSWYELVLSTGKPRFSIRLQICGAGFDQMKAQMAFTILRIVAIPFCHKDSNPFMPIWPEIILRELKWWLFCLCRRRYRVPHRWLELQCPSDSTLVTLLNFLVLNNKSALSKLLCISAVHSQNTNVLWHSG